MYDTDTMIIGGGPTGLTLAIGLLQNRHRVLVIDDRTDHGDTSRAAVVHPYTLEQLEPYGITERLLEQGLRLGRFTIRDRGTALVPVPFGPLPTRYPYTLMISQAATESIMLDRLTELGGTVLRPRRLTDLTQDADGVTATVESEDGAAQRLRARYLVGADGMHSTVRDQVRIGYRGSDADESFALADVRLQGDAPTDEVGLYFAPAGTLVLAPLPDRVVRMVATVTSAPEHPDIGYLQQLLDDRGPGPGRARVTEVIWGSRFRVHHRVADDFRSGRVLIAGDAAHTHSPAGGQGMNTGITDATALAGLLSRVLAGEPDALLDDYGRIRRPVAQQVLKLAGRLTRLATVDRGLRRIRNVGLWLFGRLPPVQRRLARQLSGLVHR